MAKPHQPTVKVKVVADTDEFRATLAELQERAAMAKLLPGELFAARRDALAHAVRLHSETGNCKADDVVATAGKLNAFLTGNEHAQTHVHMQVGADVLTSGDMHAEQAAQAHLAKHTGL
ncbi:hypothetical protein [Mycolicibacterium llatzerense]|uniref:hypothetical protein n=1 Tax=Mycolicibacterium llatzerense TaxID=280871 RepID=UPI0021B665C1|nr:hypothetical protein [Mycolicibacterium llatzerense]MCT7369446.1 hypothetical protein [Mycolicibacterium llatzerense]